MHWMLMPLRRYAEFSGRSRRMEYWMWVLFQFLIGLAVMVLMVLAGGSALMSGDPAAMMAMGGVALLIYGLYLILALVFFIPNLAVTVRRLHDTNRSGWWILAPLAPYLLMIVAASMAISSPDSAGFAGMLGLIAMLAVLVLGITVLVFLFLEGTRGPNQYGADPKAESAGDVFA
jgi:uncharacterized membrane protein YhaH (DUF805 family)